MKNLDFQSEKFTIKVRQLEERKALLILEMANRDSLHKQHDSEVAFLLDNHFGSQLMFQLRDYQATEFTELKSINSDNRWKLMTNQKCEMEAFLKK